MSQGTIWFFPIQHAFGATGVNVAGAKAYFFLAGSSTPVAVYTDVGLTIPHTVPVVADGNGVFAEIFLTPGVAYKVDLQTSGGVSLTGYPADNQLAIPLGSSFTGFNGTAGEALTAPQAVYLSDGSGGKNAGQWYKADSANTYSSTLPEIGIVPSNIAIGTSGIIQQSGRITGFTTLTPGALYYIGTAGAITATAPTNARAIGIADSATSLILDVSPRLPVPNVFSVPIGSILPYGGAAAPSLWLLCDGSSLLRASYPALFTAIGTAFGSADGTHFTLPALCGGTARFPLGKATAGTGSTLGGTGGAIDHAHTSASHTHAFTTGNNSGSGVTAATGSGVPVAPDPHTHTGTTASTVPGDTGTNNPPFQAVNYIILAGI